MIQSKQCDTHKGIEQCDTNERCAQNSTDEEPQCICKRGYERIAGVCTQEPTTVVISTTTVQPDLKHNSGGTYAYEIEEAESQAKGFADAFERVCREALNHR